MGCGASASAFTKKKTQKQSDFLLACAGGDVAKVTELLEADDIDVNYARNCEKQGDFPLIVGGECGHVEILKLLIAKKADIAQVSPIGESPLIKACYRGHLEASKVLIDAGANVNHRSMTTMFPLFAAVIANEGVNADITKALLAKGADVNMKKPKCGSAPPDHGDRTPFQQAAIHADVECMKILLDQKKIPPEEISKSLVEICRAVDCQWVRGMSYRPREWKGELEGMMLLLENGADPNFINQACVGVFSNGQQMIMPQSPLLNAVNGGSPDVVLNKIKLLLAKGAKTDLTVAFDLTAYDIMAIMVTNQQEQSLSAPPDQKANMEANLKTMQEALDLLKVETSDRPQETPVEAAPEAASKAETAEAPAEEAPSAPKEDVPEKTEVAAEDVPAKAQAQAEA